MLSNLGIEGMAAEDGPRLDAHCALRESAPYPCWRAPAITPDVPFCASGTMATVVVLARHSAPEWVRLAVPTTPDAERVSACCSNGTGGLPRLLLLLRPERHKWGTLDNVQSDVGIYGRLPNPGPGLAPSVPSNHSSTACLAKRHSPPIFLPGSSPSVARSMMLDSGPRRKPASSSAVMTSAAVDERSVSAARGAASFT